MAVATTTRSRPVRPQLAVPLAGFPFALPPDHLQLRGSRALCSLFAAGPKLPSSPPRGAKYAVPFRVAALFHTPTCFMSVIRSSLQLHARSCVGGKLMRSNANNRRPIRAHPQIRCHISVAATATAFRFDAIHRRVGRSSDAVVYRDLTESTLACFQHPSAFFPSRLQAQAHSHKHCPPLMSRNTA